jgi:hypothetical protein
MRRDGREKLGFCGLLGSRRLSFRRLFDSTPVETSLDVSRSAWLPTTSFDMTDHLAIFPPSLQKSVRRKQKVERGQELKTERILSPSWSRSSHDRFPIAQSARLPSRPDAWSLLPPNFNLALQSDRALRSLSSQCSQSDADKERGGA